VKLALLAGGSLLAVCFLVVAALRSAPEPTYKGLTMGQWLNSHAVNAHEALLVLGTNNLPLLVNRIAYDPEHDTLAALFFRLHRLTGSARMYAIASRRLVLADDAHGVFYRLGPKAAPAIPQLARIVEHGGGDPSSRALSILAHLGDEGLAIVASKAAHPDSQVRLYVVVLLGFHTESSVARFALTNALNDPDFQVRQIAWASITNRQAAQSATGEEKRN